MSKKARECVKFGKLIKRLRKQNGLTQEDFADKAGLDVSYIGRIERGVVNPGLTIIYRIAAALQTPPNKLVRDTIPSLPKN